MFTKIFSNIKRGAATALLSLIALCGAAQRAHNVEWHNEASDTTRITHILIEEARHPDRGNPVRLGMLFNDTPYGAHTLEGETEALRVNLDSMDCTTFVETVAALAVTAREGRSSWQDFLYNLERIRYRQGTMRDYTSRLHYISDWALDNQSRGLLREVTAGLPGVRHNIKTLNFMTRNRRLYPALADSVTYAGMRSVEAGFSNYRYPYLRGHTPGRHPRLHHLHPGARREPYWDSHHRPRRHGATAPRLIEGGAGDCRPAAAGRIHTPQPNRGAARFPDCRITPPVNNA